MSIKIERARVDDVDELLKLYFMIYQNNYPLKICSDRDVMLAAINDQNTNWYVARDDGSQSIIASAVFQGDPLYRIGKLTGVVVHPHYRKKDLASKMIDQGTEELLMPKGKLRSIYATTRTVSRGPQIMCLRNGFLPLGIFPNAHKIAAYETLTLMAKYAAGVIESKAPFTAAPEKIAPILGIFQDIADKSDTLVTTPDQDFSQLANGSEEELDFEMIKAPQYVMRRFNEIYSDPYDRFFPFHEPNILMASTNGEVEIFGYINEADGYLAIASLNISIFKLARRVRPLMHQLRSIGVSYIEVLIGLQFTGSLQALLDAQFLPSAIYPAMYEVDGKIADFVIMTRTLEPLNFRGMQLEAGFKPYLDLYVKLWKSMYLETLEVFDEYQT